MAATGYADWGTGASYASADIVSGSFCDYPQAEYKQSYGANLPSLRNDEVVFEIESYNPIYSRVLMKMGSNPLPPEGAVIISKNTDPATGVVKLICGVPSLGGRQGVQLAEAGAAASNVPNVGIFADGARVENSALALAQNPNGILGALGITTVKQVASTNPLDDARSLGVMAAKITAADSSISNTRSFEGGATAMGTVIEDEVGGGWGLFMMLLFIVVVLVGICFKTKKPAFIYEPLERLWGGA